MDAFHGTGVSGSYDDTSLNGAEFRCCPIPDLANNSVPKCSNNYVTAYSTLKTSQSSTTLTTLNLTYGMNVKSNQAIL